MLRRLPAILLEIIVVREVREVREGDKEVAEVVTVAAQEEGLQEAVQLLLDTEPLDDRSVAIPYSVQNS